MGEGIWFQFFYTAKIDLNFGLLLMASLSGDNLP